MGDEEPAAMSVKDRIAALKLNQVGRVPGQQAPPPPPSTNGSDAAGKKRPPPPPPPARPSVPARPQSTNIPTSQHHVPSTHNGIANQPEEDRPVANANGMDGISRPSLPPRTSTQGSRGPALPPRNNSSGLSPAPPSRRPSETPSHSDHALSRKTSSDSVSSMATARSSVSGVSNTTSGTSRSDRYAIRAPSFDPASLPPLPPKRTEEQKSAYYDSGAGGKDKARRPLKSTYSSPNMQAPQNGTTPPPERRPSALPQLPQTLRSQSIAEEETPQEQQRQPPPVPQRSVAEEETRQDQQQRQPPPMPQRSVVPPPPQKPKRSALELGFGNKAPSTPNEAPPPAPTDRPSTHPTPLNNGPPPVPKDSRPDLAALQASKPKFHAAATSPHPSSSAPTNTTTTSTCLHCRDFSAPDTHAARFPRASLPHTDIAWLATHLTAPFPASPTDQARAIFTWLHHNIAYDTHAFFSGNLTPSTPQSTLASGRAVCEGYAGLLAALALAAGLESYVVSGHGKGFGHTPLSPADPLPPFSAGHAWNAVRLPDSLPACAGWKLVDACWGAGHICGTNHLFKKEFAPERFTQSNEVFGLDHFPGDASRQFRADGRTVSWEEYIRGNKKGCGARFFAGYTAQEGISEVSFLPRENPIPVAAGVQSAPSVRFSFQKVCPHWDPVRNGRGKYYLYALQLPGERGGKGGRMLPFEWNGEVWWCDVPTRELAAAAAADGAGEEAREVKVLAVTSFRGGDGRGVTAAEFREWQGRCAMGWGYVAKWELG